jgi:Putative prokaryotic signal transducing protein
MHGDDDKPPRPDGAELVEVTRVQPFEAEVIAARLRASGIEATVGADSPYESLSFAEGIAVLVSARDEERAKAVLESDA